MLKTWHWWSLVLVLNLCLDIVLSVLSCLRYWSWHWLEKPSCPGSWFGPYLENFLVLNLGLELRKHFSNTPCWLTQTGSSQWGVCTDWLVLTWSLLGHTRVCKLLEMQAILCCHNANTAVTVILQVIFLWLWMILQEYSLWMQNEKWCLVMTMSYIMRI